MKKKVVTTYLEMTDPSMLRPAPARDLEVMEAQVPSPELSRFLYTAVGGDWYWIDRLSWTYEDWSDYLNRPGVRTWVAYHRGTPAGYFELDTQEGGAVEIVYFGLLPAFLGRGFGGDLLTRAVRQAWKLGASKVWLHTNNLDGPKALTNYRARGFRISGEETSEETLPERTPGPWPGARGESTRRREPD